MLFLIGYQAKPENAMCVPEPIQLIYEIPLPKGHIMNFENLKRILIAAIAIGVACVLVWALFKLTVFLFTAAAILIVAGVVYAVIALKMKARSHSRNP
jgi:hypothetical protein